MTTTFIIGGARSGKSARALALAEEMASNRIFIATAEPGDAEMKDRIARHQRDRGDKWETVEAPVALANAITSHAEEKTVCVVDCLTLWLSNLMHAEHDIKAATSELCLSLEHAKGSVVLVSNELGLGLVPETTLGRQFRDEQGRLNQRIAAISNRVEFVAAGLPLMLKV